MSRWCKLSKFSKSTANVLVFVQYLYIVCTILVLALNVSVRCVEMHFVGSAVDLIQCVHLANKKKIGSVMLCFSFWLQHFH